MATSVRYVGIFEGVEVRLPEDHEEQPGERVTVQWGELLRTTAEQAESLLEQDGEWAHPNAKTPAEADRPTATIDPALEPEPEPEPEEAEAAGGDE